MKIRNHIHDYQAELSHTRRELHKIPEYSFEEYETSAYLFQYLEGLCPDVLEHVAGTGVKAVFLAGNANKTVAIRADIDALPVEEINRECAYRSDRPGYMHACGHDGHMAIALVTAKIIAKNRDKLKNNYVFLFQPAEETTGGALPMILEGVLKEPAVDEIYGIHLWPYLPLGVVGTKSGALMADMCDLNIKITGKGSHGAKPQQGTDALVAAAQLVTAVQTIVSRNVDPYQTAVITIGKIVGGETRNVICETVVMEGTIRTFEPEVTHTIKKRLHEVLMGLETMFGVHGEYTESMTYPAVVNARELYEHARELFGDDEWECVQPVMLSEDFSNYQKEIPGLFAFLGTAIDGYNEPLHSNTFDFDEHALLCGVEYFLRVTGFDEKSV